MSVGGYGRFKTIVGGPDKTTVGHIFSAGHQCATISMDTCFIIKVNSITVTFKIRISSFFNCGIYCNLLQFFKQVCFKYGIPFSVMKM